MAKLLFVILFVGISVCKANDGRIPVSYTRGHEYVYDYETQIMSGLPEGSKIYSGLKLVTQAYIQMVGPNHFKMQFRNPRLFKINGLIDTYDPTTEMIPIEAFTELLNDDAILMKTELVRPWTFMYTEGHIEHFMTEGEDPEWSVNIKKGCVSLLEVNFNERRSQTPNVDVKSPSPFPHIYTVFEPCVAGDCETTYRFMATNNNENTPVMQLEKVRNFENCVDRVMHMADMFRGFACEYCNVEMPLDTFNAQSLVRYEMTGTSDNFMIVSAVAESMYAFIPYTEQRGKVMTFTNQTFTLVERRQTIDSEIPQPKSPKQHSRPLKAIKSAREDKLRLEPMVLPQSESDQIVQRAMKMLTGIATLNKEQIDFNSDPMIKELWWWFSALDIHGWNQVINEVMKKSFQPPNARKIVLDLIPTVGTFESVDVLLTWMENNRLEPELALTTYMTLSLIPTPDLMTVERFVTHMQKFHQEPTNTHLFRTAFLTLGTLGMKANTINNTLVKDLEKEIRLQEQLAEQSNSKQAHISVEALRNKLEKVTQRYSKIQTQIITMVENLYNKNTKAFQVLALRVMYNLRFEHFIPLFERLATDKTQTRMLRHEAIDNLMRFDYDATVRDRVRSTVLPIFFDHNEPDELRLLAFIQVLMSRPTTPELEMISKSLYFEPSKNVGSFVWDALVIHSNFTTTCACVKSIAHNATLAMRFAKRPEEAFRYSSFWAFNAFDSVHNQRYRNYDMVMFSPEERFPTTIASFGQTTFFGKSAWLYGLLFRGRGLDTLVDSLSRSPEMSTLQKLIHPKFKRSVSENAEKIQELKEKLEIKPRAPILPEGVIDIQLFDQTIFYFDLEPFLNLDTESLKKESPEAQLKKLQEKVVQALPEMLSVLGSINKFMSTDRTFIFPFMQFMMPTEVGLPFNVIFDWHGAMKFDGEMTFNPRQQKASPKDSIFSRMGFNFNFNPSGMLVSSTAMFVDVPFFFIGLETKERFYMDVPITMELSGNMDKTKVNMKITDLTAERPFMYEGLAQTFVYHVPFHASQYPQPVDTQLIVVTADADMSMYSYELGQDFFGFKYTIEGEWSRPKSSFVEQFPYCGKRTMYVKFDPLEAREIDIHFQHTQEYVRDRQEQDAASSSMFSRALSWLFNGENKQQTPRPEQADKNIANDQPERPALQPVEPFINLDQKELTIPYLESRFKDDVEVLQSGWKCGMAVTIVTPGHMDGHKVQFTTLYQMNPDGFTHFYTMDLCHFTPENPNKPWKMVSSTKFSLPSVLIEPSSLQDNEYQRQVQEEISRELARDQTDSSAQFDVSYYIMINSIKQLMLSDQRDNDPRTDIQELINHILEQSVSPQLKQLETLVQDQRRIEREVRQLTDRPVDIINIQRLQSELNQNLRKSEEVMEQISSRLSDPLKQNQQQKPQQSVMIQYLIISQSQVLSDLQKVVKKVKPVISQQVSSNINSQLESLREKLADIVKRQIVESSKKQAIEEQRDELEVEQSERKIQEKLIELEKKLLSAIGKLNEPESLSHERKPSEHLAALLEIARVGESVSQQVSDHLVQKVQINKVVRVKIAEVLLQMTQLAQIVDTTVREMSARVSRQSKPGQSPLLEPAALEQKKKLLNVKIQMQTQVETLTRQILLALNAEKEMQYLESVSPEVQNDIKALNSIMIKQARLSATLRQPSQNKEMLDEQILRKHLRLATEIDTQLHGIMVKNSISSAYKISPMMLKCAKLMGDHLEILDLLRFPVEMKVQLEASSGKDVTNIKAIQRDVLQLIENTLRAAFKILQGLNQEPSGQQSPLDDIRQVPQSLTSLVRQAVKVDAKQLLVKSDAQKIRQQLQNPAQPKQLADQPSVLKQKLEKLVQSISDLQDQAESLHSKLSQEVARRPSSQHIKDLRKSVVKRQEQLLDIVRSVEDPLKIKSTKDSSLLKPLQSLQKLKDRVQRKLHAAKLSQSQQSSQQQEATPEPSRPQHDRRRLYPDVARPVAAGRPEDVPQPRDLMSSISGETTIMFGWQGGKMKTILFKFMGKKTLQQLLWESEQNLPSKQDPIVKRYLSDKDLPNDRTALDYSQIKSELNSYRHMHFFCTYEESIPWTLKNYMFRFHQSVKYFLYDQAHVSLPNDPTPLMNKFEVLLNFDRGNRWMSMRIDTANELTRVDFLEVPSWFRMTVFPIATSLEQARISQYVGSSVQSCYVSSRRIKTFDGERLMPDLQSKPCESVLAMDCSPHSEFSVTKQPKSAGEQKISVLTKQHKLDVIKSEDGQTIVKNDDSLLDISEHPVVLEKEGVSVHVSKLDNQAVLIMIPSVGIHVATNGDKAAILVNPSHKSRVCGLCGNMDGLIINDLAGSKQVLYPGARSMASTFLVPSNKCDVKAIQKGLKVDQIRKAAGAKSMSSTFLEPSYKCDVKAIQRGLKVDQIRKAAEEIKPELQTDVISIQKDGKSLSCFSATPIKKCPAQSKPTTTVSRNVEYRCIKQGRKARKLISKLAESKVISSIANKATQAQEIRPVREPVACN